MAIQLCGTRVAAVIGGLCIGMQFVGCLYVCTRGSPQDRDDPRVIKQRFLRVGIASVIAPLLMLFSSGLAGGRCTQTEPLLRWFGLWPSSFAHCCTSLLLPLLLTALLFLGPLTMHALDSSHSLRKRLQLAMGRSRGCELQIVRNLLIGPLSEEWVFRACTCPLLYAAGLSEGSNVLLASLIFGAAHLHHRLAGFSWAVVGVQFSYTSLFGAYSSYLFLRTGQLIGPFFAHSFCNLMGLPDFKRVPHHPHARLLTAAFICGISCFALLLAADLRWRPRIFDSLYWNEE